MNAHSLSDELVDLQPSSVRDELSGPQPGRARHDPPLVSVVIPTRNRASILPRAISAALNQDLDRPDLIEVVVVNDGSTDGTADLLAGIADPRLRVVTHATAGGVSRARNDGTQAARGHWVAWCDDDDVWAPEKLRSQIDAITARPGARWSNGGAVTVDDELRIIGMQMCPDADDLPLRQLQSNVITAGGSGVLAERALALEVGGFDESLAMYADWHMWARLAVAAPIATVDRPLVAQVDHLTCMSHNRRHLYAELVPLRVKLADIAAAHGMVATIDETHLKKWILKQQIRAGRRADAARVRLDLQRNAGVSSKNMLAGIAGIIAPARTRERWERRERDRVDPEYARAAETWLERVRRAPAPALAPSST